MTENNKLHLIEHANDILFQLVTKLKDYNIDVKVSGDYEYSEDYTSLDFVERVDELDFSQHDKKFKDEIKQLKHDLEEMKKKVGELESELSVKDNLLKTKNGLCGEKPRIRIIGVREFDGEQYVKYSDVEYLIKELKG